MRNDEELLRLTLKHVIKEKKEHDKKFNQVSDDITSLKNCMRENRKDMDLIRNK